MSEFSDPQTYQHYKAYKKYKRKYKIFQHAGEEKVSWSGKLYVNESKTKQKVTLEYFSERGGENLTLTIGNKPPIWGSLNMTHLSLVPNVDGWFVGLTVTIRKGDDHKEWLLMVTKNRKAIKDKAVREKAHRLVEEIHKKFN